MGGGLEAGTACLLTGRTGAGKSTLGSIYVEAAAKRGENSIVFYFDERQDTFLRRSASLKMNMSKYIEQGLVELRQVNTGELSPGEFAQVICRSVEEKEARVVMIDSLTRLHEGGAGGKIADGKNTRTAKLPKQSGCFDDYGGV